MGHGKVTVKVNAPCGTVILDHPERCNALSRSMISELSQAIDDLHHEKKIRGIVLTGAGPHFCSGLNLHELLDTSAQQDGANAADAMKQWFDDGEAVRALVEQMLRCPKPIIAAIDGAALGTGFALCLAADLVVASHRAQFGISSAKHGIVSGITIPLLNHRLGAALASRMAIGGEEIDAVEAKNFGLVHHVVDSDQIWVRASNWVDSISTEAAEAIQLSKKVLNEMAGEQLFTMLSSGAAAMATGFTTEAAQEGLAAFVEKRAPKFP